MFILSLLVAAVGCKSTEEGTGPQAPEPPPEEQPLPVPADEPPVEEEPPEEREPTTRTVQGFRIQVAMTQEESAADARYEEARSWWSDVPQSQRPSYLHTDDVPIKIEWQAPYYRVRLGAFASRDEAQRVLELARSRFPDAFLVPDRVTITRVW